MIIELIYQAFIFLFGVFLGFYVPGRLLYSKLFHRQSQLTDTIFSLFLGLSVFTASSLFFAFAQARWLGYGYFLASAYAFLRNRKFIMKELRILRMPNIDAFLIVLFSIIFSLTVIKSGWFTTKGFQYYSVNGSDGLWHVALINEMTHAFPPEHPGFSGLLVKGYHFFYDFLLAEFQRLLGVSSIHLHFHFFPLVLAILWCGGVYILTKEWFQNRLAALLATFFSVFGGSFSFIVPWFYKPGTSMDDALGITQPYSSLVNPQYSASALFVIFSLYSALQFIKTKKKAWLAVLVLFGALSAGFKVYAGMIVLGTFVAGGVLSLLFFRSAWVLIGSLLASLAGFLMFRQFNESYGFLVYEFLWPTHRVMQGGLDFTRWELKRQTMVSMNSFKGLVKLEVYALLIFLAGNLGTRLVGLYFLAWAAWKKKFRPLLPFYAVFIIALMISSVIPLFFIQPVGGAYNMIQMFWYFLLLFALPTGYTLSLIMEIVWKRARFLVYPVAAMFMILTLPSAYEKAQHYLFKPPSYLEVPYTEALRFLSLQGKYKDTVLEIPKGERYKKEDLEFWFSNISEPYVPSLGNKRAFISDETVSFPYEDKERRIEILTQILKPKESCTQDSSSNVCRDDINIAREELHKGKMAYILTPSHNDSWVSRLQKVNRLFTNGEYSVYEVYSL